jgi:hypothetical protein
MNKKRRSFKYDYFIPVQSILINEFYKKDLGYYRVKCFGKGFKIFKDEYFVVFDEEIDVNECDIYYDDEYLKNLAINYLRGEKNDTLKIFL